jgi:hypothetical protein
MTKPKASNKTTGGVIECVHIRSKSKNGFRRCGYGFTESGAYYDIDLFDEEQRKRLSTDPHLIVSKTQVKEDDLDGPYYSSDQEK